MLAKLYAVVSVALDVVLCLAFGLVNAIVDFWIPIALFCGIYIGLIIIHVIFVSIVALFVNIEKPCKTPKRFFRWWVDYTMELLLFFARVKIVVKGIEKIPENRRFLVVSNHISNLDPIVGIVAFMKYRIIYISKPENFKIPVVSKFIHQSGFLPIDRVNARNAMKTIHKATDYVKDDVGSVCIYPEGTRSKTGQLLEFKDGVFYICKKAPCPLVVITVKNTEKAVKNFPFKSTRVEIDVLETLEPEFFESKSTHELSEHVRDMMLESLNH